MQALQKTQAHTLNSSVRRILILIEAVRLATLRLLPSEIGHVLAAGVRAFCRLPKVIRAPEFARSKNPSALPYFCLAIREALAKQNLRPDLLQGFWGRRLALATARACAWMRQSSPGSQSSPPAEKGLAQEALQTISGEA